MDEARELTKEQYYEIQEAAHALFRLISRRMGEIQRDRAQTDEWAELHDLSKLAGVIGDTAYRYAQGAPHDAMVAGAAPLLAEGVYRDRG